MCLRSSILYVTTNNTPVVQNLLGRNYPCQSLVRARPEAGALPQNSTTGIVYGAIDLDGPLRNVPDRGERVVIRHRTRHLRT